MTSPLHTGLDEIRRDWVVFVLLGILLGVAGIVALSWPFIASDVAVLIWGWFLMIRGVFEIVGAFYTRRFATFLLYLALGFLALILGGLIVTHPLTAAAALTLLLAAFFLVGGVTQIIAALYVRYPGWLFGLLAGVVGLAVGVSIFSILKQAPPEQKVVISAAIIGTFVGIDLVFRGLSYVTFGLGLKNLPQGPGG